MTSGYFRWAGTRYGDPVALLLSGGVWWANGHPASRWRSVKYSSITSPVPGSPIAAVTAPESVALDGTLFVRVATSPWMNELQLMAPEIMARINAGRGVGRIRTIRWLLSS